MSKKYIVRLTDQERDELAAVVKKFKGTSQKVGGRTCQRRDPAESQDLWGASTRGRAGRGVADHPPALAMQYLKV